MPTPSDTQRSRGARLALWTAAVALGWGLSVLALYPPLQAFDVTPEASSETAETPRKQWVWLEKQGLWGYGYQREDGLWVIDPGSKREPTSAVSGDRYGFLNWLNAVRAQVGLAPVGYDPSLEQWAAANNAQQASFGLGHHVMGPARRQNCAVGHAASIGAQWMASPAHRAALLDPTIRAIGIAGLGAYWTFNAF